MDQGRGPDPGREDSGEVHQGQGLDARTCALLLAVHDHYLALVGRWLSGPDEVIAGPVAALRRHGLPTEGAGELPLTLDLAPPAAMQQLQVAADCWPALRIRYRSPALEICSDNSAKNHSLLFSII